MVSSVKEFCGNTFPICDLMPSGANAVAAGEKRRAIGFNRDGETLERSAESVLLEQLGYRRAIGFGREGELIKNGPSGKETAVGFNQSDVPAAVPAKHVPVSGFSALTKAFQRDRSRD